MLEQGSLIQLYEILLVIYTGQFYELVSVETRFSTKQEKQNTSLYNKQKSELDINMKQTHKSLILATCAGLISLAAYGNTDSTTSYVNSVYAFGDYYQMKPKGGESTNYAGGTIGYVHNFNESVNMEIELTYLSDSYSETKQSSANYNDGHKAHDYTTTYDYDLNEYRASAMFGVGNKTIISFGLEYILTQSEGSYSKNGTEWILKMPGRTYKSQPVHENGTILDSNFHYVLAKTRVHYPIEVFSTENHKIVLTPAVTCGAGGAFGDDYSAFAYEGDAKCAISYFYSRHSVIVEGGYRILGTVKDDNNYTTGIFGRAGYAFSW